MPKRCTPSRPLTHNDPGATRSLLGIDPIGERITKPIDFDRPIVSIAYGRSTLWVGLA